MKTTFLLAVASFGIFALSGCGNAGDNTNTAANTGQKTNATATKTANILKPGDVSPDKAIKVSDLVDSVASDKDAWKGKEVAVTGYVSGTSGSESRLLLTMTDEQTATNKRDVSCALQGVKSADVFTKTVQVKGKISSSNMDSEFKSVNLDPCELKK
ncbi:MAG TPA: hypothetical protein DC054_19200 [Blastocatellia bacterium]|nr:hypothetical protein [Blastocatellia bacterium]